MKKLLLSFILLAALVTVPSETSAEILGFNCLSFNDVDDCATLEAQVTVELTQTGDWLNFILANSGPEASFMDGVYFRDPASSFLGGSPVFSYSTSGIKFSDGCAPGDLPNGWGATDCADADAPAAKNGVNPGEWLMISYALSGSHTLATVLAAIEAGTFSIGIKVQGFEGGGSEWGVLERPPVITPEPSSLLMLGIALGAFAPVLRRRRH